MKILAFNYFLKKEAMLYYLKDETVVIDAHHFFYNLYEESKLPFAFGCESNRFAIFLRKRLSNFSLADLKCFFIFKGSRKNLEQIQTSTSDPRSNSVLPIFAMNIYKQVLDEMGFDYVTCPMDNKDYCITLASRFCCPVIAQNIEYALVNISYIPHNEMVFDNQTNSFKCLKFNLDIMLKRYRLNIDKLVMFIVLTNTDCFPENHFKLFFKNNRIPLNNYQRIVHLLKWLSVRTKNQALDNIIVYLNNDDRNIFIEKLRKTSIYLKKKQERLTDSLFLYGDCLTIKCNDPLWFEKGVLNKFIPKPYADLYYSHVCIYKRCMNSCEGTNEYLLSIDIIIYAYNLLTNYTKDQFSLNQRTGEAITSVDTRSLPFPKPVYEAENSVFENGWDTIGNLRLLEHFLNGTMKGIELKYLDKLPPDARLLMISITYYTIKSENETSDELYSILLSYIMLGIVFEDRDDVNITRTDCKLAIDATKMYFQLNETEIKCISDSKLIHPLIEFEHCLEQMNYLNALCGYPYKATIYSKTYNGTFVYKILHSLKTKDIDREDFFVIILKLPHSVYDYLQNLSIIHERLIISVDN